MAVVLLGYRGSGKTTVGRKLADQLWGKFVDTDELVTEAAGKTIKQIFDDGGEPAFRELESAALRQALVGGFDVIALGGGAVLRDENRTALVASGHKRVYLRADAETLHRRIDADPSTAASRPALTALGGSVDEVRTLLAAREPLYREVATAELDVTNLSPDECVSRIARMM
jgi:shikimate kinase